MNQRSDPFETQRSTVADGPSEYLRSVVQRNRGGATVGTYAVCSAHPAVIDAAIQQALEDGNCLHVESTSSQVNQFGGYTGMTPEQFAEGMRVAAASAGLPPGRVLLGADHLGPFAWRSEPSATAMAKARELAGLCIHAGYQKIHLDTSMPCGDDKILDEKTVAERTAILCRAAEDACEEYANWFAQTALRHWNGGPAPGRRSGRGSMSSPDDDRRCSSHFGRLSLCVPSAWLVRGLGERGRVGRSTCRRIRRHQGFRLRSSESAGAGGRIAEKIPRLSMRPIPPITSPPPR